MAQRGEPSYTELVYEVLRSAAQPLTFPEIFDAVNRRRPVTTKDPKATIRNALTQGRQLVNTGDGRYGYLPHLLQGSLLRLPLTDKKPANHPLIFSNELHQALSPSFYETGKRRQWQSATVRLPNGSQATLRVGLISPGIWGSPIPEELRRYLVEQHASAGDALLIRVLDGEAGQYEAWLESHLKRDGAAVARRNKEMADAAYQILRPSPSREKAIWEIAIALLGRGCYRSDVAPDPVEAILKADPRFEYTGLYMWMLADAVTPEIRALTRARERLDFGPLGLFTEEEEPSAPADRSSVQDSRRAMESAIADISAVLKEREFSSIDEANAFLRDVMARDSLPRHRAATSLDLAQDIMYDAWDTASVRERVRLAKKALDISPECADAYVLLAEDTARGPKEAAELYAKGVAAGERALGTKKLHEDVGHFWGLIETRPYMRARLGLALALRELGQQQQAIDHAWEMLRLNPNDNQGVRYILLNWLLEAGDEAQVKRLLGKYKGDSSGVWLYGETLHAYRAEGDTARSRKLLARAMKHNPYVPDYLLKRKRLPKNLPDTIGFGDVQEAVYCAAEQIAAWQKTPAALAWLSQHAK